MDSNPTGHCTEHLESADFDPCGLHPTTASSSSICRVPQPNANCSIDLLCCRVNELVEVFSSWTGQSTTVNHGSARGATLHRTVLSPVWRSNLPSCILFSYSSSTRTCTVWIRAECRNSTEMASLVFTTCYMLWRNQIPHPTLGSTITKIELRFIHCAIRSSCCMFIDDND